ncbi:MAG: penicillin-binding transpeptidase domain-containing protein [Rikenellaceae bacterium]
MLLLIGRVAYLQFSDDRYNSLSYNNVVRKETIYASRGEILDRNGEYVVQSRGCYDMMVTYRNLNPAGFDTLAVCSVLDITLDRLKSGLANARMRPRTPYLIANFVSVESRLRFDELRIDGFHSLYRTVRQYPRKIGGNLLGHIGEINETQLRQDNSYSSGDYIGISGVESAYEQELRGNKGSRYIEVNTYGVVQGAYLGGVWDTLPKHGSRLVSTIDARLQLFGEELLVGKVGAVVAIEPSTGEILMMVSSPTFDPDELVGRDRGNNYMELLNNPRRPLFNRAVTSRYPPGSIFKIVQALIGMQEGVLSENDVVQCYGEFNYGTKTLKCHNHAPRTTLNYAISTSCNTYFCHAFCKILDNRKKYSSTKEAYDSWRDYVLSFGFGRKLGSDFLSEGSGYVPNSEFYDRVYRKSWNATTAISLSIGQGELGCTPLHMANFAAIIANRGEYYIPHIVRQIDDDSTKRAFTQPQKTLVEAKHFNKVIQGMWECVNLDGSARWCRLASLDMCGKTGTSQNPHGEDHSTFLSFAPRNDPKIAISVYIENGSWGSVAAVPIATLITEFYLNNGIAENRQWLVDYVKNLNINYPVYEREAL